MSFTIITSSATHKDRGSEEAIRTTATATTTAARIPLKGTIPTPQFIILRTLVAACFEVRIPCPAGFRYMLDLVESKRKVGQFHIRSCMIWIRGQFWWWWDRRWLCAHPWRHATERVGYLVGGIVVQGSHSFCVDWLIDWCCRRGLAASGMNDATGSIVQTNACVYGIFQGSSETRMIQHFDQSVAMDRLAIIRWTSSRSV